MKRFLKNLAYGLSILVIGLCFLGVLNQIQPAVAKAAKKTNTSKEDSYTKTYNIGLMSTPAYIRFDGEDAGDYSVTVEDPSICELGTPLIDNTSQAINMNGLKYGTTKLKVYKKENGASVLKEIRIIQVKKSEVRSFDITTGINQRTNILSGVIMYPSSLETYTVTSSAPDIVAVRTSQNEPDKSSIPVICKQYDQSELYTRKAGSSTITVKVKKGGKESTLGKLEVFVKKPSISKEKIVYVGRYIGQIVENQNGNCTYSYTSSNESVVSVDDRGSCTVRKAGKAKITVKETSGDVSNIIGAMNITVLDTFPGGGEISLSDEAIEMGKYSANLITLSYGNVDWEEISKVKIKAVSKNKKVVTIKDGNIIYPVKAGTAEVLVKVTYKGVTKTIGTMSVKVINKPACLDKKEIVIEKPYVKYIDISYKNRDAKYTYVVSNPKVASIGESNSGDSSFIKGMKNGTTTVTVKETLKGKTRTLGKIKVTVK